MFHILSILSLHVGVVEQSKLDNYEVLEYSYYMDRVFSSEFPQVTELFLEVCLKVCVALVVFHVFLWHGFILLHIARYKI